MCFVDYDRQMALVAELPSDGDSRAAIIGVGRLVKLPGQCEAELAVVISDSFQKRGIGSRLTQRLIEFARDEKLIVLTASVLFENRPMQKLLEKHGFVFESRMEDGVREGKLPL